MNRKLRLPPATPIRNGVFASEPLEAEAVVPLKIFSPFILTTSGSLDIIENICFVWPERAAKL